MRQPSDHQSTEVHKSATLETFSDFGKKVHSPIYIGAKTILVGLEGNKKIQTSWQEEASNPIVVSENFCGFRVQILKKEIRNVVEAEWSLTWKRRKNVPPKESK